MQSKLALLSHDIHYNLLAGLSLQEIPAYMSTGKNAYINGINQLFYIIQIGNRRDASEAQKKEASQAWTILSIRLLSQLSILVPAILSGKPHEHCLIPLLEKETFCDTKGLVASLEATSKQQAPSDSIARIKALQIGISIALHKPVTKEELQFLNKLANIPTYRALALFGLLPLLSASQIHGLINTTLVEDLSDRERQLLLPALTPFVTPFDREDFMQQALNTVCCSESTCKASIDFLLILMKQLPQLRETFIQKAMHNCTRITWDIRERELALRVVFREHPDLITDSVLLSLCEKLCRCHYVGGEIPLIETIADLWKRRPDLLRDPQFRERIRQNLFAHLPIGDDRDDRLAANAVGRALVQLSEILDKDKILGILLAKLHYEDEKSQRISLRVLVLFYEKHPNKSTVIGVLAKCKSDNPMVKPEAERALMALLKLDPSLLLKEVQDTFRLFDTSSWPQDHEAREGAMTVLINTVAEADPFALTPAGFRQTEFALDVLFDALTHDSEIIVSTAIDGLSQLFELRPNIIDAALAAGIWNLASRIKISLGEKYWKLIGLMYGNKPNLLPTDNFELLLRRLPNITASACLSALFSKSPQLVTSKILETIVNNYMYYIGHHGYHNVVVLQEMILTIFEKRPDLLNNNKIVFDFLSSTLDKYGFPVSADFLNALSSFIEKNPKVLPPETAKEIITYCNTPSSGAKKAALALVLMRNTPTDIATVPIGEPFFAEVDGIPQQFDTLLKTLQRTTNRLIAIGSTDNRYYNPEYRDVKNPAEKLVTALKQAQGTFFIHSYLSNPSAEALQTFKDACNQAITDAEGEFINHHSIWDEIHPILKKILGVLALIPLGIPAILVEKYSTQGYVGTFFKKPKLSPYQELQVFKTGVNGLLNPTPPTSHPRNLIRGLSAG